MKRRSRGFTLIELLVVVSIIALLISILLPSLGRAKELANRAYCAANLRGMYQSMLIYDQDLQSGFPSVPPDATNPGTAFTNAFAAAPFSNNSSTTRTNMNLTRRGSPIACLWILPLDGLRVPAKMFLCKSDRWINRPAFVSDNGMFYENFQSAEQISYSIAFPWSTSGGRPAYWSEGHLDASTPMMSDMAPLSGDYGVNTAANRGSPPATYSSPNHEQKGQNVAFGDGHVEWTTNPYVGRAQDNMWTVGTGNGTAISQTALPSAPTGGMDDIVMVPNRKTSDGTMAP